jgi:branched-chain amino acid transport system permease protein
MKFLDKVGVERSALLVGFALLALFSPFVSHDTHGGHIALMVAVNIVAAVGLNLINGHTGQFSLGHAGFMAAGAYAAALVTMKLGPAAGETASFVVRHGVFGLALVTGGAVAAVCGFAIGLPTLRLRGDYLAIVTLGFAEIIRVVVENSDTLGRARGLNGIAPYTDCFWAYGAALVAVYITGSLVNSTYGRGFLAVRDDEIAAGAMGVNTTRCKVTAFVFGAFFAGVAGALYAHLTQTISPEAFGLDRTVDIVVMVILGGMGNTFGVVFAAILLTVLPEGMRYLAGIESLPEPVREFARNRMLLYAALLIVFMLLRPQGLFGGWNVFEKLGRRFARGGKDVA